MHEMHRKAAEDHLNSKGVSRSCSACGKGEMVLFDRRLFMAMDESKDIADFFALMCPKCSHTLLFSVRSPGLLEEWAAKATGPTK